MEEILLLREQFKSDPAFQQRVAPYDHRALTREAVAKNPLTAPAYAVMVPGYALAKAIRLLPRDEATTRPSMRQVGMGLAGIGDGVKEFAMERIKKVLSASN